MRKVIIENKFATSTPEQLREHADYARACLKDTLSRGEAPFATHLLYMQQGVLDGDVQHERQHGLNAGLAWYSAADACVVYTDYGISREMQYGIDNAHRLGKPVEYRMVPGWKPRPALAAGMKKAA